MAFCYPYLTDQRFAQRFAGKVPPAANENTYWDTQPDIMQIVRDPGSLSHKWDVSIKTLPSGGQETLWKRRQSRCKSQMDGMENIEDTRPSKSTWSALIWTHGDRGSMPTACMSLHQVFCLCCGFLFSVSMGLLSVKTSGSLLLVPFPRLLSYLFVLCVNSGVLNFFFVGVVIFFI